LAIIVQIPVSPLKPSDLDSLPVIQRDGRPVFLSSVADIVETVDTSTVRRVDSRRTVTLNIIPPDSVALEQGVEQVRNDVIGYLREQGVIPNDMTTQLSGAADQLAETQAALMENYLLAVAIVYLLMVAIFAHWGHPLLIMTTIPMGISAGIAGLALLNGVGLFQQPFDMITMLGFLILMGTVINNPILVIERTLYLKHQQACSVQDALSGALKSRIRPIAITTVTTLCGIAPLVFIPGEGTELYRGVGTIVMFGLMGAAIVTVTTLPALTALFLRSKLSK
jgi:multidrug efflux pump subunit AcrB